MSTSATAYMTVGDQIKSINVDGSVNIHGVDREAVRDATITLVKGDRVEPFVSISFPAEKTFTNIFLKGSLADQAEALKLLAAKLTIMASEIG